MGLYMHFKFKKFSHANQNLLYSYRVGLPFLKISNCEIFPLVLPQGLDQQRRNASKSYSYESLISLVLGFDCDSKIHI